MDPSASNNGATIAPPRITHIGPQIGRGGFGVVFKARYDGEPVAIKHTRASADVYDKAVQDEVAMLSKLSHPRIVRFYGVMIEDDGSLVLVLEYMTNGSLYDYYRNTRDSRPSEEEKIQWSLDIAYGIQYLHSQQPPIIHRDLKSQNILMSMEKGGFCAKVSDFGSAVMHISRSSQMSSKAQSLTGSTRYYQAPELNAVKVKFTTATDVYAYGVILSEIISWEGLFGCSRETMNHVKIESFIADGKPVPFDLEEFDVSEVLKNLSKKCAGMKVGRPTIQEAICTLKLLSGSSTGIQISFSQSSLSQAVTGSQPSSSAQPSTLVQPSIPVQASVPVQPSIPVQAPIPVQASISVQNDTPPPYSFVQSTQISAYEISSSRQSDSGKFNIREQEDVSFSATMQPPAQGTIFKMFENPVPSAPAHEISVPRQGDFVEANVEKGKIDDFPDEMRQPPAVGTLKFKSLFSFVPSETPSLMEVEDKVNSLRLSLPIGSEYSDTTAASKSALLDEAFRGNAESQHWVGMEYFNGTGGFEKNDELSVRWLRMSANQGYVDAQYSLGNRYFYGEGAEQNFKEAVKWYTKAGNVGMPAAQNNLGFCYKNGHGVKKNLKEAFAWYSRSAEKDNWMAQFNLLTFAYNSLGICYLNGEGVAQDHKKAVKWFTKAAYRGVAESQYRLGQCFYSGVGVEQDFGEAVKWFAKSASEGNSDAQDSLGVCYQQGQGVKKDLKEAVKWITKSAEQGNPSGQYKYVPLPLFLKKRKHSFFEQTSLGVCYGSGNGVVKDLEEAVKWYIKSAEQCNADAQFSLACCYYHGIGVERDLVQAVRWYTKSAEQGNVLAQFNWGVEKDLKEAEKWYRMAAAQGDNVADMRLVFFFGIGLGVGVFNL
ncbi:hypothetical protein HDU97_008243 [Phlyctochytrium planicorne]|nr:hypothetical protein HDU97_008243 [Phlyctochytrium planicorne]